METRKMIRNTVVAAVAGLLLIITAAIYSSNIQKNKADQHATQLTPSVTTFQSTEAPTPTPQYLILNEKANYLLPLRWRVQETINNPSNVSLISPDYAESPRPAITKGAKIQFSQYAEGKITTTLRDYIVSQPSSLPPTFKVTDIQTTQTKNHETASFISCFEECVEHVFVKIDDYVWRISFYSVPATKTNLGVRNGTNYPIFRSFLNNITFRTL